MDLAARIVRKNGAEMKLTPTEYSLLRLLVDARRKSPHASPVAHRGLGAQCRRSKRIILRVHIAHLRDKLEDDAAQPKFITTEPAVGYRVMESDI